MADQDENRTEQATPFKLREARERGQVARSMEFSGVAMLVCFAAVFVATAGGIAGAFARATTGVLLGAGGARDSGPGLANWIADMAAPLWLALSPLVLALLVAAVLVNVGQTGPVFSFHPLGPDFTKLNPANGFKRLFSGRTLFELAKMLVKFIALGAIGWLAWRHAPDWTNGIARLPEGRVPAATLDAFVLVSCTVLAVLGLFALVDLWFARREFGRQMRMSHREVRQEHKRREGDPEIRARRKRLQQELLKRSGAVRRVKDADLVVTNPTHVAVALRYRPQEMRAPVVLAKGAGHIAARIREEARRAGLPVLRVPALARQLFREVEIDGAVPESAYADLAPLYRWLLGRGDRGLPA